MLMKKAAILLWSLFLVGSFFLTASAHTTTDVPSHTVTLEGCTIGEGETVSYTTISPQFAGQELPEGMYAGNLTVEISGQIVVEKGGTLSIGTLSIGSDQEASPVISGDVSQAPLIIVKAGGTLKLTTITLDIIGEGLFILQEPGSSISITDSQIPQELVQWAPPTVDNLYDAPDDLWLEKGTPLDFSQLPSTLLTNIQEQGQEERMELPVSWDTSSYDGRTTGECTFTGSFLDESGQTIPSMVPLTITVHWYQPDQLVVTDAKWSGQITCSAHFTLLELSEYAEVTGEISTDGGKTWDVWSNFDVGEDDQGNAVATFYEVENTPQYYRIVAVDSWIPAFWASESFLLPLEEGDDSGGNRGGSTTPVAPDREPTSPEPEPSIEPEPTPTPSFQYGDSPLLDATITNEAESIPAPESTPIPVNTSAPESTPVPETTPAPENTPVPPSSPSPSPVVSAQQTAPSQSAAPQKALQIVLVAGGIIVCAAVGIWIARKKK